MDEQLIKKWLAEGKISEEQANVLLEDIIAAQKEQSGNSFLSILSILGSVFLGIGIIWIVASNWDGIPDPIKVAILIGFTLGLLYLGYDIGFNKKSFPKTGHALILLGAILFGASIFLIAQIFHVQAHSHYLFLIWLIGVLPLVYIFKSPLITFLSCVVFCLWINTLILNDYNDLSPKAMAFVAFFYQTFGILLFALGSLHYFAEKYATVARTYRLIGIYLVLSIVFIFTFRISYRGLESLSNELVANTFMSTMIYMIIAIMIGINFKFNPSRSNSNVLENTIAMAILITIFALNLAIDYTAYYMLFWLLFNALFVGLIIILFRIGYNRRDMKLVNIASFSTFFFLVFKFFDLFSNLLDNGLLWLVFGILLLSGSLAFEKKRRKIRDSFRTTE